MEESLFSLSETGGIELWEVMDAYKACRRHKRNTVNALRFELNWEAECVSLWEDINNGTHGLPIGNLTSQLLALLHLDELDHLVTERWGIEGYGRYVDDMVFVSRSRRRLLEVRRKVDAWLSVHGHRLHPKKMYLQHYGKGVLFIGGMILPGRKYMSRRTVGFLHEALEACQQLVGDCIEPPMEVRERVRASMNSYFGMLQHYDALRLTGSVIRSLPQEWFRWMYIVRQWHRCKMVVRANV